MLGHSHGMAFRAHRTPPGPAPHPDSRVAPENPHQSRIQEARLHGLALQLPRTCRRSALLQLAGQTDAESWAAAAEEPSGWGAVA